MSLPSDETILNEPVLPQRRAQRTVIPAEKQAGNPRLARLDELACRSLPGLDTLLYAILAGAITAAALWLDSPALLLLALLAAPFAGSVMGLSVSALAGSGRFFLQSLGGVLLGSLPLFAGGAAAGYASRMLGTLMPIQALGLAHMNWPAFFVLSVGALFSMLGYTRGRSRHLLPGVALGFGLYIPAAVSGYGLGSGLSGLFSQTLLIYGLSLAWAVLVGAAVLVLSGQRPVSLFGWLLGLGITAACLAVLLGISGLGSQLLGWAARWANLPAGILPAVAIPTGTLTPIPSAVASSDPAGTPLPQATSTPLPPTRTPLPTHTLVPTSTPVATLTPAPTPVWALIRAVGSDGAFIRSEPRAGSQLVTSLLNESLVEVLPEAVQEGNTVWVRVRTEKGLEGWIVQSLLATATPVAGW